MKEEIVTLKREELYRLVWSTPVTQLAKKFGISDVGLAKICKKMKIPRPGRGYWEKVSHGRKPFFPPLPPAAGDVRKEIHITKREKNFMDSEQNSESKSRIDFERKPENQIRVEKILVAPLPEIEKTRRSFENARTDEKGLLKPRLQGTLDLRIGPNSLERALRIMDALLKALEGRGHQVSIKKEGPNSTSVSISGETIEFGIEEKLNRRERELTPVQKKEKEKSPWMYSRVEYDYTPSGNLFLKIKNTDGAGVRKTWTDGINQRIERSLNSFIIGLIKAGEAIKADRLERERRNREWEEERKRSAERERRRYEEGLKIQAMDKEIATWQKSQQIREYVKAVEDAVLKKRGEIQTGSELDQWLRWAKSYADRIDPLTDSSSPG
jgi:hypothetical protein